MNKQTILIVEDEKEIADTLEYALGSDGFVVRWVSSGQQARDALAEQKIDFCILDVGLPDCNGLDLLREIRQSSAASRNLPVLMLTARAEEIDRVVGLEIGADDYVCKPFSPREVVARVKNILRRVDPNDPPKQAAEGDSKQAGFEHNIQTRSIHYQGESLQLTRSEYVLLAKLLAQPSQVFSRRQLIEQVWSSNHPSDDRVIDTHIKTLRAKLRTHNPHQEFIITHRGFGYSMEL